MNRFFKKYILKNTLAGMEVKKTIPLTTAIATKLPMGRCSQINDFYNKNYKILKKLNRMLKSKGC